MLHKTLIGYSLGIVGYDLSQTVVFEASREKLAVKWMIKSSSLVSLV